MGECQLVFPSRASLLLKRIITVPTCRLESRDPRTPGQGHQKEPNARQAGEITDDTAKITTMNTNGIKKQ
jgi:hypothetical protein